MARPMPLAAPVTSTTWPRTLRLRLVKRGTVRSTYPVMSDPFRGDVASRGARVLAPGRGRPRRRHPARAGAYRHRRRRARPRACSGRRPAASRGTPRSCSPIRVPTSPCTTPARCSRRPATRSSGSRRATSTTTPTACTSSASRDVAAAVEWVRGRGAEAVVLFGNSGGGSLMALAHTELGCGDAWVGVAAHPGEGEFMLQSIDPSVADEHDPCVGRSRARHVRPRQRLAAVAGAVLVRPGVARAVPRRAARARRAHRRPGARALDDARRRARPARAASSAAATTGAGCASAPCTSTTSRSTARSPNPAYLDLTIDPDDRPLGSLFAFPDPFDANYGWGGLARTMTSRGWLSTWSALSSKARLADDDARGARARAGRPPDRRHRDPRPPGAARSPTPPAPTTSPTSR